MVYRFLFLLAMMAWTLPPYAHADKRDGFSIVGVWMLKYQVCMLLKIRTKPVEIAAVLNKDKSTISSIRTRLCKKVLGKEGSGKDWDEFVLSL